MEASVAGRSKRTRTGVASSTMRQPPESATSELDHAFENTSNDDHGRYDFLCEVAVLTGMHKAPCSACTQLA